MMSHMTHRDSEFRARAEFGLTRRRAVASFGAVGMAGLLAQAARAQQPAGTPVPAASPTAGQEVNLEATMPDWRFSVVTIQDPYKGTITKPSGVPAGIRVVAYQVVLTNNSDMPMQFSITDIRLRD